MIPAVLFHPISWVMLMLVGHAVASAWQWTRIDGHAERSTAGAWGRTAYLAGIPIVAVALRVVPSPAHMGLGIPARPWLAVGAALVAGFGCAAAVGLWESGWKLRPGLARLRAAMRLHAWKGNGARGVELARHAVEDELHWAFFRAAALSTSFGFYDAGAIGPSLWLALVLLAIEGWSNPAVRSQLADNGTSGPVARSAAMALASGLAFAFSGSSAAGLAAQLIGRFVVAGLDASATEPPEPLLADGAAIEPIVVG